MKSRVFLAISLALALLPAGHALACGPYYYEPGEYYMYRASRNYLNNYYYKYETPVEFNENGRENCLLWQKQTGTSASPDEIYQVVYKSSIEELRSAGRGKGLKKNAFLRYLAGDREARDLLILAKQCEKARGEMASPWYYPAKKDPQRLSLDEVAAEAMAYGGKRFCGRYALQAERALLSLHRYDDCINYWNKVKDSVPDDVNKKMTVGYVAGAYQRIGDVENARKLFAEAGDCYGVVSCSGARGMDAMELMYRYTPDAPELRGQVESIIQLAERSEKDLTDKDENYEFILRLRSNLKEILSFCERVTRERKVSDLAFWYYSEAFVLHLFSRETEASSVLAKAESVGTGDEFIRESIRVLRIWLDARLTPYSSAYEQRMVDNLRWLDSKIAADYSKVSKVTRENGIYLMKTNISFFYWNDMMRRVVLGAICPKLVGAGRGDRAIAFASMADNRLLNLEGKVTELHYDRTTRKWEKHQLTLREYRSGAQYNDYDYSNESFRLIDSLGADDLKRYVAELEKPTTQSSRWLSERGYGDHSYFKEILGTKLLREMRYAEAEQVFRTIPASYQTRLNTYPEYFAYDPFSITETSQKEMSDCKLSFASQMSDLRGEIATSKDPDRKALAMVKYATGMQQSVTRCWAYTFYGKSWDDSNPEHGLTPFSRTQMSVSKKAERIYQEALKTARNPEVLASIHLAYKNLATVMKQYGDTEAARSIAGKCDNYYDYHLERSEHYNRNVWAQDYE